MTTVPDVPAAMSPVVKARRGLTQDELAAAYAEHARQATQLAFLLCGEDGAQDVVHEAFISLGERCRLDPGAVEFRAYVRQAVVRHALSMRRSSGRRLRREALAARSASTPLQDTGDGIGEAIGAALTRLPPRQRAAIVMRYWADMSDADIAAALNCRPSTVRSLVARGRERVKESLPDGFA